MAEKRLSEIRKTRRQKAEELRKMGINPYPSETPGNLQEISKVRDSFGRKVKVAGRIWGFREHGNIVFADIRDSSGQIQLWFQKKKLKDTFKLLRFFDVGDFIFAEGKVIKTKAGEITIDVSSFKMLTKSIRPLPSKWYGLKDVEERYRKRYLDLLLNAEVRKRFNVRTKLIREIRHYLDNLDYWEVETPTLQPLYGGANAKPFTTHHNALDSTFYLRIADELYLKRLVIGGYEKVYEICKDFRNEGIDQTHSPEFTMIEFYEAYADYQRIMDVTEGLFKHLAKTVLGKTTLEVDKYKVDIGKKWPRKRMVEVIKEKLGIEVSKKTEKELLAYAKKKEVPLDGEETWGQLVFKIFDHLVTEKLIGPIWVIDYPRDVSPLSKAKDKDKDWVDRFEGYIGGKEICDGWSELTDPFEQRERFETDVKLAREDKEEAQQVDEDFLEAMEYGMPPLGGIGIGIDRLIMFYTNTWFIKEVILFPTLRPQVRGKKKKNGEIDKK